MAKNFLKLTDDKTQFILMKKENSKLKHDDNLSIRVGDTQVKHSSEAGNLGIIFDSNCNIIKQCYM